MAAITEFLLFIERLWAALPDVWRRLIEVLIGPIRKEIGLVAFGMLLFVVFLLIFRAGAFVFRRNRTTFDPSQGMRFPIALSTPFFSRIFWHLFGSDPIIINELPASSVRRRVYYAAGLFLATSWAIAGSYLFARYVFPEKDIGDLIYFIALFSASVFLIDIIIVSSNRPIAVVTVIRFTLAFAMGLLTSAPILIHIFSHEIHSALEKKIDVGALIIAPVESNADGGGEPRQKPNVAGGESIKAARERLANLEGSKSKLEEMYALKRAEADKNWDLSELNRTKSSVENVGGKIDFGDGKVATSGEKGCDKKCKSYDALHTLYKSQYDRNIESLADMRASITEINNNISRTGLSIDAAIKKAVTSSNQNFVAADSYIRDKMISDPFGLGFMMWCVTIVILSIDLIVLLLKYSIATPDYDDREIALEELAIQSRADFQQRSRPQ